MEDLEGREVRLEDLERRKDWLEASWDLEQGGPNKIFSFSIHIQGFQPAATFDGNSQTERERIMRHLIVQLPAAI